MGVSAPNTDRPLWISGSRGRIGPVTGFLQAFGVIAMDKGGLRPGATGAFPFRFGRQPIGSPFLVAQPPTKVPRIAPRNVDHRMVIGLFEARVIPNQLGIHLVDLARGIDAIGAFAAPLGGGLKLRIDYELPELSDRDLMGAQVEAPGQFDFVERFLRLAARLVRRRTHRERPRRHIDKLHAETVRDVFRRGRWGAIDIRPPGQQIPNRQQNDKSGTRSDPVRRHRISRHG